MNYAITKEESQQLNIWKFFMMMLVIFQHGDQNSVNIGMESIMTIPWELQTFVFTLFLGAGDSFFFISGILLFSREFKWLDNIKKKFWRLVVPYFFFNLFWILAFWIFQSVPITQRFFTSTNNIISQWDATQWLHAFGFESRPFVYPLWYIRDLFILNLFAVLIKKAIDRFPIVCLIILLVPFTTALFPRFMPIGVESLCFFCGGYYFVKYKEKLAFLKKVPVIAIFIIYVLLFILVMKTHFTENYSWQYEQLLMVFQMWLWYRLSKLMVGNESVCRFVNKYSPYLYSFFLMHEYLLSFLKKAIAFVLPNTMIVRYLDFALTPFLAIVIIYIICIELEKLCPAFYALISGSFYKYKVRTEKIDNSTK